MIEGSCHCGAVHWQVDRVPDQATACNCTLCRKYGTLWAYDFENQGIRTSGPTTAYSWGDRDIGFHFCPTCGGLAYWRAVEPRPDGRRRMAVNLRLAAPEAVAGIAIEHLNGLEDFEPVPGHGRTVGDLWF